MDWVERKCGGVTLRYGNKDLVAKNADEVPAILEKYGVAVLPGVLTSEECTAMRDGAWATATTLLPNLKRDDPGTYGEMARLQPHHGGLIQWHRWAHAQYIWDVRSNPKVAKPFEKIFGTSDLKVSFDGINFGLGYKEFNGHHKLHIDQDFRPGSAGVFRCVQSWVTSEPVGVGDATLRCYPGSHKLHDKFCQTFNLGGHKAKPDWFQLSFNQTRSKYIRWFTETEGLVDTCITAPAGSMVLWDSRTVHSGIERLPTSPVPPGMGLKEPSRDIRNLAYVCFMPAAQCMKGMETRKKIFNKASPLFLRTCSHWPDEMRPFDLYPPARMENRNGRRMRPTFTEQRAKWNWVPKLEAPVLTERGYMLAGIPQPTD